MEQRNQQSLVNRAAEMAAIESGCTSSDEWEVDLSVENDELDFDGSLTCHVCGLTAADALDKALRLVKRFSLQDKFQSLITAKRITKPSAPEKDIFSGKGAMNPKVVPEI